MTDVSDRAAQGAAHDRVTRMSVLAWVAHLGHRIASSAGHTSAGVMLLRPVYEHLLNALSAWRGVPWTINGVPFRVNARRRNQMGQEYDPSVAAYLRSHVRPGALCLNVGANVGVYTLQLAHWGAPSGRVIAFEPNPRALRALRQHLGMNGLTDRVTVVPAAVGASAGRSTLYTFGTDGRSRLHAPNAALAGRGSALDVPVLSLDDYCAEYAIEPDWLVADVEGSELDVLEGAANLLRRRGAALGVVVELHPAVWQNGAAAGRVRLETLLRAVGRRAVALSGQRDALGEYGIVRLDCV